MDKNYPKIYFELEETAAKKLIDEGKRVSPAINEY